MVDALLSRLLGLFSSRCFVIVAARSSSRLLQVDAFHHGDDFSMGNHCVNVYFVFMVSVWLEV